MIPRDVVLVNTGSVPTVFVTSGLACLVKHAASAAGFTPSVAYQAQQLVSRLMALSLAHPCPFPSPQLSSLAGGLPLEFSVNVGPATRPALRCAAEVGNPHLAPYPRALSALENMSQVARELRYTQSLERILPSLCEVVSPDLPVPKDVRFWVWGGLDIATIQAQYMTQQAGASHMTLLPILKVYLNLMDRELGGGGRARLEAALSAASIPLDPAVQAVLDRLDTVGFLHELGFGLGPNGWVACKLYYELRGWQRTLVSELLRDLDLPADPEAIVPEIPGILRESLAAKSRAGISLRLDPVTGAAIELTIAAAFPRPMLTPQVTAERVTAWIDALGWDSVPYQSLANVLLPDWQAEDQASAALRGHVRMHSLFTRTVGVDVTEATIYIRPWMKQPAKPRIN